MTFYNFEGGMVLFGVEDDGSVRGAFRAELRPLSGATIHDLDRRRLKDYFGRVRQQTTPADSDDEGWLRLLINTEIMVEEGVTLSGMLLFGKTPNRFLPQAGIEAAAFPGLEKIYATKERATLRGPIPIWLRLMSASRYACMIILKLVRRSEKVVAGCIGTEVDNPTSTVTNL